ncbi:MAG: HNH endonuclease [Armatimonadetes bacterium]|nr:HNH endonuclease [Armatimonadota bacterium]
MEVLVLNYSYQVLNITSMRRAIKMLWTKKADIIEVDGKLIRSENLSFKAPTVIKLNYLVNARKFRELPANRKNILWRDRYICQYCGKKDTKKMTIDHVIPKSLGGKFSWENLVCACLECNNRKNNRTLQEVQMKLIHPPGKPKYHSWIKLNLKSIPHSWAPYLS